MAELLKITMKFKIPIFTDVEPEELAGEEEEGLDLQESQESQEARKPPRGMLVTSYSQYYCTISRLDCSQHYTVLVFYISPAVHTMADMCLGLCFTIACQIFRFVFAMQLVSGNIDIYM